MKDHPWLLRWSKKWYTLEKRDTFKTTVLVLYSNQIAGQMLQTPPYMYGFGALRWRALGYPGSFTQYQHELCVADLMGTAMMLGCRVSSCKTSLVLRSKAYLNVWARRMPAPCLPASKTFQQFLDIFPWSSRQFLLVMGPREILQLAKSRLTV